MSRLGHGLRGATRRMSFQSSFKPSFSSNYTRFASASSFTQSTKSAPTMTMSYPQTMSAMTPSCMVFSSISLTPNMEQGSHLIGLGSTSSALSEEEEEDDVCINLTVTNPQTLLIKYTTNYNNRNDKSITAHVNYLDVGFVHIFFKYTMQKLHNHRFYALSIF
eukprot:599341_1